jgi:hypothetical protein
VESDRSTTDTATGLSKGPGRQTMRKDQQRTDGLSTGVKTVNDCVTPMSALPTTPPMLTIRARRHSGADAPINATISYSVATSQRACRPVPELPVLGPQASQPVPA